MFSSRVETIRSKAVAADDSALLGDPEFGQGGGKDVDLLAKAESAKRALFAGRVFPIAPLYVTSVCSESCLYCNFRGGNKGVGVERRRLTDEEIDREARFLIEEKGLRVLELVYSTDPLMRPDSMCRHVEILKRRLKSAEGGLVGINAESLETAEYRMLHEAGLDFCVLWQETYDPERYRDLHPGRTKKARFEFRVDSYERMLAGGIEHIGMGVLSGLADWRRDWAALFAHEAYLKEEYGRGADILGLPRLKPAPGATLYHTPFIPSEQEFLALTALHNFLFPNTLPFVSTREPWDMCVKQAAGGGCLFTLNCSTTPGGYSLPREGCQFPVNSYDAPEFVPKLRQAGLEPEFSWTFESAAAGGKIPSR